MTLTWAPLAVAGAALTLINSGIVFTSARKLRGLFWTAAVLFGEAATVPLHLMSIAVGLIAALPVCSAVLSVSQTGSSMQLSLGQFILLTISVLFRIVFWPAIGADWSKVRRWEQEMVRRPRGMLWANALLTSGSPAQEVMTKRASVLGQTVAKSELSNSSTLSCIPKQTLGLLFIFCATLHFPNHFEELRTEVRILLLTCCLWIFATATVAPIEAGKWLKNWFILLFSIPAVLSVYRFATGQWPFGLNLSMVATQDISRLSLLSVVFLLTSRDIAQLLELRPAPAPEVGLAPLDRRYSFLKKITQTSQWLAQPSHLLALLMQLDILLATLRITVTWS